MSNPQAALVTLEQVTVAKAMDKYKDQMLAAIDDRVLDPVRFMRIALTVIRRKPELEKCTLASILGAFVQCGQIGLYPDDIRGYVYLIPYNNRKYDADGNDLGFVLEADLLVGYQGWIELFRQSGFASDDAVNGRVVNAKDEFDYAYEVRNGKPADWFRHKPSAEQDPGSMNYCYAVMNYRDGKSTFSVLSKKQAEKHRDAYAKTKKKTGPWFQEMTFPEMAIKTCIRKASKYAPSSPSMRLVASLEEMSEAGVDQKLGALIELTEKAQVASQESVVTHPSSQGASTGKMAQFMKEAELEGRDVDVEKTPGGNVIDKVTGEVVETVAEGEPPPAGDLAEKPASQGPAQREHEGDMGERTSKKPEAAKKPEPEPKVLSEEETRAADREIAFKGAAEKAQPSLPVEEEKAAPKKNGGGDASDKK